MVGAATRGEKRKPTTVEKQLLTTEELVDTGLKSTVRKEGHLLELIVWWSCWSSSAAAGLSLFMAADAKESF
jgi:hypothetical protein